MEKIFEKRELIKKSKDFSGWYNDVILRSELADYSPIKGCQVLRPYGYSLWENIQNVLDGMIKGAGVQNAYFPLFIPYSFLKREKEHVKGFSPELAIVTHGGGKKLPEPLVVRPTSETIMYEMFAKWIKSWRDLPFLINQWCNVVRWEKRTHLFLRTTEFLWQEGHTSHASQKEAEKEALRALKMYQAFVQDFLALPVLIGKKSASEKFAGAKTTYTLEALMPDGKALQCGTSHELGQNFSKPFNIVFQNEKGEKEWVWQTSWGMTTRIIGALIMAHGDDQGLIIPPKIAPIQTVIVPIFEKAKDRNILGYCSDLKALLEKEGFEVELDDREEHSPGWKFHQWELKGVALRLEVGNQEVKGNFLTVARRDNNLKLKIKRKETKPKMKDLLEEIQKSLYSKAQDFLKKNSYKVDDFKEFQEIMDGKRGLVKAFWCENPNCEQTIKKKTKATTRLLALGSPKEKGKCVLCQKQAEHRWYFGQAY